MKGSNSNNNEEQVIVIVIVIVIKLSNEVIKYKVVNRSRKERMLITF